jgi:hypothetical protein
MANYFIKTSLDMTLMEQRNAPLYHGIPSSSQFRERPGLDDFGPDSGPSILITGTGTYVPISAVQKNVYANFLLM